MIFKIILNDCTKNYDEMYKKIANPIHESLVGNTDYLESNIILNIEDKHPLKVPACNVFVNTNDCKNKEYLRTKLKNAIDIFIDSL